MVRIIRFLPFLIILLISGIHESWGQTAWTKPKGKGYFKLSQSMVRADGFFNPEGEITDIRTTSVYQTLIYGEYGLADRFTMILDVPLVVRSTINNLESRTNGAVIPGDEFTGFGDIKVGLRYGILTEGKIIWSASVDVKTPTGDPVGGNSELLQTGDGAWGLTFMSDVSHSFYPKPIYISGGAGINLRGTATLEYSTGTETIKYSDGVRWRAEIGFTPKNWLLSLKLNHLIALKNGDAGGPNGSTSLFGNNVTYLAITPEVAYGITDKFGVAASAGFVAYAENILAAPNFILGIFYELK